MAEREWTFMVFMAGDNNLSAAGDADLAEMRQVGSSARVAVIVEFDNAGNRGTVRLHVEPEGREQPTIGLGETDSGSPAVLTDFVEWAVEAYPARRYALILWNHGSGWEPSEIDRIARAVGSPGYSEREIGERAGSSLGRAFFRSTIERVFALPSPAERAICSDDGTGHSLDTLELRRVLARVVDRTGRRLDLLGFDACLMSNLEVAYEVRPYVRCLVGSEENEPNQGWPYDRVLAALAADPEMDASELAGHIVRSYLSWYAERDHTGPITQAALDLDRLPNLTDPLDVYSRALQAGLPGLAASLWRAQRNAARFWHNTLWDLGHLVEELGASAPDAGLGGTGEAILEALRPGDSGLVLAEGHRGSAVARCRGLSIYLLPPLSPISRFYPELAFAREQAWLPMLEAYHAS